MSTLIGTVGFFDETSQRGFIHPDYNYQSAGLNVLVTKEGLQQSGIETIDAGLRVTCVVNQGQDGMQAFDIKPYEGTGI